MSQEIKTYRAIILRILQNPRTRLTCNEVCKRLITYLALEKKKTFSIASSVSGILYKLVKDKKLEYCPTKKGPRGGNVYQKFTGKTLTKILLPFATDEPFYW